MQFDFVQVLMWASVAAVCLYSAFVVACVAQLRRGRRFDSAPEPSLPDGDWAGVTVLKPCAGADDDLEACLESYFRVRYPKMQLLFGVRSESDAAFPVIERVRAKHPEIDSAVFVTGEGAHVSPKISQMEVLSQHAKYDLWWLSDSNTKVHPDTLWDMVARLGEPNSALVASPIVGDGEETLGASLENLHLNAYVVATTYAVKFALDRVAVPGKSMLVPKSVLLEVGGWQEIGKYFADDEVLVQAIMDKGYRLHLGAFAVQNVNAKGSMKKFFQRHLRWSQIRWRVVPHVALLEFFVTPVIFTSLLALASPTREHLLFWACALVLQIVADWALHAVIRGRPLAISHLWLLIVRPFLVAALLFRGAFSGHVEWRGNDLWMGSRARILTEPPLKLRLRALRAALRG
ncbi:MAG: glycosyltransferase [Myxococcales bacterium]|nr:glycosyltransferase [Myxococcales bacterium]